MAFTCRLFSIILNFESNGVWNSLGYISAEIYTKYRKYWLRGSFIYKSISRQGLSTTQLHLGRRVVIADLAVEYFPWLKFQNYKTFSKGSLLFRTLIVWCFINSGSELRTPWLTRFELEFGLHETKSNWIPQPPNQYRSCRIQIRDPNNMCTALLR